MLVLLYTSLASSWNILGGFAGQTNLGHAAFFGLGGLLTRFLWLGGWPLIPSLLVGGLVAVAFALLIGFPAFRLRGVYFAIGTLALAQVLYIVVGNTASQISSLPTEYLATYQLAPRYYLVLGLAILTIGTAYMLRKSRRGLGIMAVREQEDAAESLGVSALKHKLLALSISAFLAGLTGGAFAFYHVGFYPQLPFAPEFTFDAVMMTYIGGVGTVVGPVIGAVFFVVGAGDPGAESGRHASDRVRHPVHPGRPFPARRAHRRLGQGSQGACTPNGTREVRHLAPPEGRLT